MIKQHSGRKNRGTQSYDRDDIIFTHDLAGNLTFLNRVGENISGYSCAEARHMNIAQLVAPELAELVRVRIAGKVKEHLPTVYEIDIIAKDGRRVPLEVSSEVILRNGRPIEIHGIAVPSVLRS